MQINALPAWDSIFSDPVWQKAGAFSLQAPSNVTFATPPEKTEVRVLWCKDFLLVRFDCQDQSIVRLPGADAAKGARDLLYFKADAVEAFLDPVGDGQGRSLRFRAAGLQQQGGPASPGLCQRARRRVEVPVQA